MDLQVNSNPSGSHYAEMSDTKICKVSIVNCNNHQQKKIQQKWFNKQAHVCSEVHEQYA